MMIRNRFRLISTIVIIIFIVLNQIIIVVDSSSIILPNTNTNNNNNNNNNKDVNNIIIKNNKQRRIDFTFNFNDQQQQQQHVNSNKHNNNNNTTNKQIVQLGMTGIVIGSPYYILKDSDVNCLSSNSYDLIIFACWANGMLLSSCTQNIKEIEKFQMTSIEHLFMYPNVNIGTGSAQITKLIQYASGKAGLGIYVYWIDVSSTGTWSTPSDNQLYYQDLFKGCHLTGATCGTRTDEYSWSTIFGPDYTYGSSYPLWYVHNNDDPSFTDFQPFGGWTKPSMKTFQTNATINCFGADEAPLEPQLFYTQGDFGLEESS